MKSSALIVLTLLLCSTARAQENDSLPYELYKDRVVLFSDVGFNAAPFSIKNNFPGGINKIQFKHNLKPIMGLGIKYKWFGLRIGFGLPGHLRAQSRYGKSNYTDIGVNFSLKKLYWDIDLRSYSGYVIKDANRWNDTLNELAPNDFRPNTRAISTSINVWYLNSKSFRMDAVLGKVGHYTKPEHTWYLKSSLNLFGVSNDGDPLIPDDLVDTTLTKTLANSASSLDLGIIPGYAYVNRVNNWQFSFFAGLGGVLQAKFFDADGINRGFLGLAPRVDLRLLGGYSKANYFFLLVTDFDIKSIKFQEISYNQTYYSLKLVGGVRLKTRQKKRKPKK
ncbi:MAG: hypothetical protein ACI837_000867 [Crocinitomicaceae bacterium]|jgi:hypothetical protein